LISIEYLHNIFMLKVMKCANGNQNKVKLYKQLGTQQSVSWKQTSGQSLLRGNYWGHVEISPEYCTSVQPIQ
jgi:hypothetical protein